ncbi:hypothetical protein CERSUDRAFT_69827 [Gelatoporia subvermispora B]|uniref:Uncharacterized protein n=1 Tax=Ceriporiopsis subvermispora (strain B) TaxID=914234 RepID=M2RQQ1_CERS8|nr:hypothetical protein CERSUDRAFT_69827 [Gelatoporia subvermispora B]
MSIHPSRWPAAEYEHRIELVPDRTYKRRDMYDHAWAYIARAGRRPSTSTGSKHPQLKSSWTGGDDTARPTTRHVNIPVVYISGEARQLVTRERQGADCGKCGKQSSGPVPMIDREQETRTGGTEAVGQALISECCMSLSGCAPREATQRSGQMREEAASQEAESTGERPERTLLKSPAPHRW